MRVKEGVVDSSMFRNFNPFPVWLYVLAFVGAFAIFVGGGFAWYWIASHLQWVW